MTGTAATAESRGGPRSPLLRYALFQIPGAVLVAIALLIAVRSWDLSPGIGVALLLLWVLKDAALYPVLRIAYEAAPVHGAGALLGSPGTSVTALAPEGWVQVGPERWRARLVEGHALLAPGSPVRVREVVGHTLLVAPAPHPRAGDPTGD